MFSARIDTPKNEENTRRPVLHNELDGDYSYKTAKSDLDEAILLAENTRNGRPQCEYRW